MNFVDPVFLIFFGAFLPLYFALRDQLAKQNFLLTLGSYFFYGWFDWRFCFLLLATTAADFYFGIVIDAARHGGIDKRLAKYTLVASLIFNLGILGVFKYFNFFADTVDALAWQFGLEGGLPLLRIALPAGISFYVFQSLSYIFDIYDGRLRAARNFIDYSVFVSFFPHLVAGPILRARDLLPKIVHKRDPSADLILSGCQLALWGFFIKLVIADNLAPIVNDTYRNPNARGGAVLIATYAFAFQIYADFLGYTSIARGISRMMGFELVLNFNLPYFSTGPREFWRRWHISLSTWLRDYLYVRLGGSRYSAAKTYRNLAITMLLGGLWHGAAWNFVAWGAFHGAILIADHAVSRHKTIALPRGIFLPLKIVLFFHVTCVGWLLFRANGLADIGTKARALIFDLHLADILTADAAKLVLICVPFIAFEIYQYARGGLEPWTHWSKPARVAWYAALLALIAMFKPLERSPFIYFQF